MEYVAHKFENTADGLIQKDAYTKQLAAQGYRVLSEKTEASNSKADNQGCLGLLGLPLTSLTAAPPGSVIVTYGRESLYCARCGTPLAALTPVCPTCQADLAEAGFTDWAAARLIVERRREAARRTAEVNQRIDQLTGILVDGLAQHHHFDWNSLKQEFAVPEPQAPVRDEPPAKPAVLYLASIFPLLEALFPSTRETRLAWEKANDENDQRNRAAFAQYQQAVDEWLRQRDSFDEQQAAQAEKSRLLCLAKDVVTLLRYWKIVLDKPQYPENFPRTYTLDYSPDEQRLTVAFTLPPISLLPQIGEVRYNPLLHTLEDVHVSEIWLRETYNELTVHLAFRIIYELFESDVVDALSSIAFHGHPGAVDKFPDSEANPVVLSLEVSKAEFDEIDFEHVNPMACFKRLGGVLSQNLASGTPGGSDAPA